MGFFKRKPKHAAAPSSPLDEHGSALSPPQARYANSRTTSTSSVSVNSTARSASPLPPIPIEAAQQQQHPRHPSSHPARLANAPNARDRTRYYDDNNGDVDDAEGEQELERERQRQRERDDPSRWQLPGLGLSPPSLGLKLPSSRSNLANASSGSSEQSPEDVRNIGYGFPPTLTERRSFRSAMKCVFSTDGRETELLSTDGPSFAFLCTPQRESNDLQRSVTVVPQRGCAQQPVQGRFSVDRTVLSHADVELLPPLVDIVLQRTHARDDRRVPR